MKTAVWFTFLSLILGFSSYSQEKNKKIIDERFEKEILIGHCDRAGLTEGEFGESFAAEYKAYDIEKKLIKKIRKHDHDYVIVLILGTWCHDSKLQVPRFYRIIDEARIPAGTMKVICVDGYKKGGEVSIANYDIEFVPTFIFYRNGQEIGRIVEQPDASLEQDFYNIIQ
ncbi:MAG: thioredoxin family protein [Bacteroidales bacterium]|nr:thioredoxin family protein [Bacteroidales bacterium]